MNETCKNLDVFEDGQSYRLWSLIDQGFLKLQFTTKNEVKSVEYSVTKEKESSNTEILIIVILWVPNFL